MRYQALRLSMLCAVFALACVLRPLAAQETAPATGPAATAPSGGKAVVIDVKGVIDELTRREVVQGFDDARAAGADTVILRLNTPGGLAYVGLGLSQFLKQQDDLHVIAYVEEMALSAGIMIGMAADEIVMQPGSFIGDSAPIAMAPGGGMQTLGVTERAKAESPILADFRDSAFRNGYDPLLAEAMVTVGRVVHWVENDAGERRFVGAEEFAKLTNEGSKGEGWKEVNEPGVPRPVDAADTLLTVDSSVAVKLGLASGTARSVEALAEQRGLNIVATYTRGAGAAFVHFLGSDVVRFLLMIVFVLALFMGLNTPGHGMPEALSIVSLGLLVGVPLLTGYAQWWEIVAILLGLALLAVEVFVLPGFGVAGITGLLLLLLGFVMTFVPNAPELPGTWRMPGIMSGVQSGLTVVVSAMLCSIALFLWIRRYLPKVPYFNRLVLAAPTAATDAISGGAPGDGADVWPFLGTIGRTVTDLRPGGSAQFPFADEVQLSNVVSDSGYIPAGSRVVVREINGNRVVVRPVVG